MKLEEFIELPKEEKEKIFGEATRKAIAETHAAGRPSCHGDNLGVYNLYPDGTKKYITEVNATNIQFLGKNKETAV